MDGNTRYILHEIMTVRGALDKGKRGLVMTNIVTKKYVRESFSNVIALPYCEMQDLFNQGDRDYYTAGVYGWGADVFIINNGTAVVTGYDPFGNVKPSYNMMSFYNNAAREIREECRNKLCGYNELRQRLHGLAMDFVGDALREKANGKGRK